MELFLNKVWQFLETIGEDLKAVLTDEPKLKQSVLGHRDRFTSQFKSAKDARDGVAHPASRVLGYIENPGKENAKTTNVVYFNNLSVDGTSFTASDGTVVVMPISPKVVEAMADTFNNILESFEWRGRWKHVSREETIYDAPHGAISTKVG